jgi:hypothetical protein
MLNGGGGGGSSFMGGSGLLGHMFGGGMNGGRRRLRKGENTMQASNLLRKFTQSRYLATGCNFGGLIQRQDIKIAAY